MSSSRMRRLCKASRCAATVAVVLGLVGCAIAEPTLVHDGVVDGRRVRVVAVPGGTPLSDLHSLVAEAFAPSGVTGLVYADFRKHRFQEPIAVYSDGALLYYNPFYAAAPPAGATKAEVIQPVYVSGGRIGAVCNDGWPSSATGRGACSGHGGVRNWRYEQILDPNAVLAKVCGDYLLMAPGFEGCAEHQDQWFTIRQADPHRFPPVRGRQAGKRERALLERLEPNTGTAELHLLLNSWIDSEIPITPFRVLVVPRLERLPLSYESLLTFLPAQHQSLLAEFADETERFEAEKGFNLFERYADRARSREASPKRAAAARRYFANRSLEVVEGTGLFGDPYWISFDWLVALDRESHLLFSFILNQSDWEDD